MNDTLSGQGHTRPEPWYFGNFLRCPQSAYVQYASIVLLVNYRNIYGQGQRVGKKSIFVPARRLIDAYWTYAEGKQRNRDKNWLFSDRVYLCPLRVMRAILKPTDIRQSRKCLFFQHFRDFIRYSNSACLLLMLTIFV